MCLACSYNRARGCVCSGKRHNWVAFAAWGMCACEAARRLDRDVYSTQLWLAKREACLRASSPTLFLIKSMVEGGARTIPFNAVLRGAEEQLTLR